MSFGGDNVSFNMEFKWNYTPIRGMSVSVQKYKIMLTDYPSSEFFLLNEPEMWN